jgi:hypothetical protein
MLSEHAVAPDRAGRQRGRPRHCSPQDGDEGVPEIARSKEAVGMRFARLKTHRGFERMRLRLPQGGEYWALF